MQAFGELNIQSLNGNLTPPPGYWAVDVFASSGTGPQQAGEMNIIFNDAAHGWATSGASGLVMASYGGQGVDGVQDPNYASGGPGGDGDSNGLTITAGSISVSGTNAAAVQFYATGGNGGSPNTQPTPPDKDNITGGSAGAGGGFGNLIPAGNINVTVNNLAISDNAAGIIVSLTGGAGGYIDPQDQTVGERNITGSAGGKGGSGGYISAEVTAGQITLNNASTAAISLTSQGGAGSNGGMAVSSIPFESKKATGGAGGAGGNGEHVELYGQVSISGSANFGFTGVLVQSLGGNGGNGGPVSGGPGSSGGAGGVGGAGGTVAVGDDEAGNSFGLTAQLSGDGVRGLLARSYGGAGGDGGATQNSYGQNGQGGAAAGGGDAALVSVWMKGSVSTVGNSSDALVFQSIGGFAGSGSAEAYGASGQSYGNGGGVIADVKLASGSDGFGVSTNGYASDGITAQSVGGGGGKAFQNLGLTGLGGSNLAGGDGGQVQLTVSGAGILTSGNFSRGIFASSLGGGGGSGGPNTAVATVGAAGGSGGSGQAVTVNALSSISTLGDQSDAILASSIGGGGGSAMSATSLFKVGGQTGGGGGNGGAVAVTYGGAISTRGADSDGIHALSVGGGGGDGANVVALGVLTEIAVGGTGGTGGAGSSVSVTQAAGATGLIRTSGDRSRGILAQSIGGGGGSGGLAATGGAFSGFNHTVGGNAGTGGSAADVSVSLAGAISTYGAHSDGILAQSIGGGGGNASSVVSAGAPSGLEISATIGGSGGGGGDAGGVSVTTGGAIFTGGAHSAAIVALATGGGGGHAGTLITASGVDIADVSVSVGGTGGSGGNVEGNVVVSAASSLSTIGDHSAGILAQSTGGGGGHGSNIINVSTASLGTVDVAVGKPGGQAGNASAVTVTANGAISTVGTMSSGISAVSTGGGGGSGGIIVNANVADLAGLNLGLGAAGGGGGSAGPVTVSTVGNIQTRGFQSDGIYAASIGGKGGIAGFHLANTSTVDAATVASTTLEIGGRGGAGGTAGNVSVTTANSISTQGDFSAGLIAQSIAGDGGRALGTVAANVGDIGNITVLVGGAGGQGGNAGTVNVDTKAANSTITTTGAFAPGIFAQSIGGGGGGGGFAGEASLNIGSEASSGVSGQVGVTIGGGGAPGGRSAMVTVQNASAITTSNLMSAGIYAQSVGGNGGDGGNVYAFNIDVNSPNAVNVNVDVGGDGGFGASGADVKLTNTGAITTEGFASTGIYAQSVGGNGGNGGSSFIALAQVIASSRVELNANVGGAGSGGGDAGAVTLTNHGNILTKAGGSDGLYAQSIGGGGGRGGNAGYLGLNLSSPFASQNPTTEVTVGVKLGIAGNGGQGANGGAVTVNNTGSLTTYGTRSRGIFAQSVGGGGGDGGTSSATSFAVSDICNNIGLKNYVCNSKLDPEKKQGATIALNSTVQIGGSGSTGGNGGPVTVNNSGNITTSGQLSHGIYAQSIGGGGGNGGEGALGIEAWTTNTLAVTITDIPGNLFPSFSTLDIVIGGSGAGGGNGGAVNVTNSGAITIAGPDPSYVSKYTGFSGGTRGALSFLAGGAGIFAQSVGGGGGDGGAGSSSFSALVTVGNTGGGGGQGGNVTVTNLGTITNTSGFSGIGIFAQSVGGGGGTAGDVGQAFSDPHEYLNIGAGIALSSTPGSGGDGGTVQVTSSGAILTSGVSSPGIVAQSIGGSGGIIGVVSDAQTTKSAGSGVAPGNGGNVTVTNFAPITVLGAGSVGIVALSAGGAGASDTSGTVTVNANANITASGSGGRAILVSSDSYKNQATGTVNINVNQGVTVQTGAQGAETILVMNGGQSSVLTNAGTIISGNAASQAIYVKTSNPFQISNYGTITGSISGDVFREGELQGEVSLNNYAGGVLNSGSEINLPGPSSAFNGQGGTLSPGGKGVIATTNLKVGNFIYFQNASIYLADIDAGRVVSPGVAASDMLTLTPGSFGSQFGVLSINALILTPNMLLSHPGQALRSGSANVMQSSYNFSASQIVIQNTAVVNYSLSTNTSVSPGVTTLVLNYDINTNPWDRPSASGSFGSAVNQNHRSFGRYLDTLFFTPLQGVNTGFISQLAESIFAIPDVGTLLSSYDTYISDNALAVPDATYFAGLAFSKDLLGCGSGTMMASLKADGNCSWGQVYGRSLNDDQSKGGPAYQEQVTGFSGGVHTEIKGNTVLGGALGYESGSLTIGNGNGTVSRFMAGAMLQSDLGFITLAGSLEGGFYSSSISRALAIGNQVFAATGSPDGAWAAAHVRANRRFRIGDYFLDPALDIGLTALRQDSYVENGAGAFNMSVSSLNQATLSINPSLTVGSGFKLGALDGQFSLQAGILALVGKDPSVNASFTGVGSGGPSFMVSNAQTRLLGDFGAAIDLSVSENFALRASANALMSADVSSYSAQLSLKYSF